VVPDVDAQIWRMPVDSQATLYADDATVAPDWYGSGRLVFSYINGPVGAVLVDDQERIILRDVLAANIVTAVSYSRVRLGLDLPVYFISTSQVADGGTGIGDLAADLKGTIIDPASNDPEVGFALDLRVGFPTSGLDTPLGSPNVTWEASAIVDKHFGDKGLLALNLGYRGGPKVEMANLNLDDQLTFRMGGGYMVTDAVGLSLDLAGRFDYKQGLAQTTGIPMEVLAGSWGRITDRFVLRGGIGTGLTSGVGAPVFRGLASIAYEPRRTADADGDGLVDNKDSCPYVPEDFDEFEDSDGCPELDNDRDGVADVDDQCVLVPEDADCWVDNDGCPEPTTVRFRVVDKEGNPIENAAAKLFGGAEDIEGQADFSLELEPGNFGFEASAEHFIANSMAVVIPSGQPVEFTLVLDGTEPEPEGPVKVTGDRIEVDGTVYFDTAKATIKAESFELLDEVAKVLHDHPELTRISIEGHTDSRGSASMNQTLSEGRARSVLEYLVGKGI
ncbi:MAG: OmpA family protein, partial [Proteobacteria bacterium]|nr:OmpA family protein [Pseudomonadota bacterium]